MDLPGNTMKVTAIALAVVILGILLCFDGLKKKFHKTASDNRVISESEDSVYCGENAEGREIWIKPSQRTMHTQVIGTTNAGKTESVIIPWAVQDIHSGKGVLLIDGKADNGLLEKLYSYTVKAGRSSDFRLFSLGSRSKSFQFNPLLGGTADEITERVFNAFEFENPYYRSLQYEVMNQVLRVFEHTKTELTFQRVYECISSPEILSGLGKTVKDPALVQWMKWFEELPMKEREMRTSGLLTAIGHFSFGANAELFNAVDGVITIDEALRSNQIVYFQLPVLLSPFLGKATGKLVLQSLQAAVANRHRSSGDKKFFAVFLDDFSEYLYPGFVSILNKSRSANVGVVFAHQALGDIKVLGDPVANSILTNSNLKVFMRGNTPESAEYFSKVIGTSGTMKFTERQKKGTFFTSKSGDVSAREVEEFVIHPNVFKRTLGTGEAIMLVPHQNGSSVVELKFQKIDDLPFEEIPTVSKKCLSVLRSKKIEKKTEDPFQQIKC